MSENKNNLAKKLLSVMKTVKTVKKSGFNAHHQYQYSTEADFIEAVRDKIVEKGILIFSSVEGVEKDGDITTVRIRHTFMDSESGETFEVYSCGQGHDKQDKGVYKAVTGAMKYFISKNFLVETQDDPERDGANPDYVRSGQKTAPKTTTTSTKPKTFAKPKTTTTKKEEKTTPKGISKPSFKKPKSNSKEPNFP